MDYYDNPYISIIKRNANPELLWFASCILLIVAMAVIAKITTWQLCRRFLSATPRYFTKKKSTWQVLNIYFHPVNAKFTTWRQILNRTMFFFPPDIMALEPSFDVPIVNITVVAGKTAVLPCSIDSLGDFKVSQIYSYM